MHFYIVIACVFCGWLAISGAIYTGLWSAFLHRLGKIGICLINVGASVILSPGLIVGHGALPFPGGLVVLLGDYSPRNRSLLIFNFVSWMLTLLFLFNRSASLKHRDKTRAQV